MDDVWVGLEERDEMSSKVGMLVCQLESKGREYEVEVATVLGVSRAKEGSSQEAIGERALGDGLSDRRLACPGQPVQPEDGGFVEVFGP